MASSIPCADVPVGVLSRVRMVVWAGCGVLSVPADVTYVVEPFPAANRQPALRHREREEFLHTPLSVIAAARAQAGRASGLPQLPVSAPHGVPPGDLDAPAAAFISSRASAIAAR